MLNVFPLVPPDPLFGPPRGRPGDWSEPAHVDVGDAAALDAEAARLRLTPDLLAALLAERELLLGDLAAAGVDRLTAEELLDGAAAATDEPRVGPGNLFFGYVRSLRTRADDEEHVTAVGRPLMLPLRLHESLRRVRPQLDPASSEQARRWELAAATEGLQMREWGLGVALRAR